MQSLALLKAIRTLRLIVVADVRVVENSHLALGTQLSGVVAVKLGWRPLPLGFG
jgi:hypothetical protein